MKKRNAVLAGVLSVAMAVCMIPAVTRAQSEVETLASDTSDPVITELPGTTSYEVDSYQTSLLSVTGFASAGEYKVSDRTEYIDGEAYVEADNEEELLEAIDGARDGSVKVIEITSDMDLGTEALGADVLDAYTCISEYGWDIHAGTYNPGIITSGVSKLNIVAPYGLTIFSQGGNTVKHAEWTLQTSTRDVVIRNLKFDGMWNWSEGASSKEAGWSLLKIYAKGVWIDHCSFTIAADGCVDTENGAEGVTMSWCTFSLPSDDTPSKDSNLYQTVTYMEYLYQAGKLDAEGRYSLLRSHGATVNQIMAYEAYHNKCNLNGSGDKDFKDGYASDGTCYEDGNQRIHITMAYNYVTNIGQRFPLLRQGTMHMVNCYIDNSGHQELQNTEPFKTYGGWSSNRAINARDGGTVGADNCVFDGLNAINGHEKHYIGYDNMNEGWDVAFMNAYNHALVVNSKVIYGGSTYVGSSWDNGGDNLFIEDSKIPFYNDGGSTINDFHWFSSIDNVENYTRNVVPVKKDENGSPMTTTEPMLDGDGNPQLDENGNPKTTTVTAYDSFTFSYSEGEDNQLPYTYQKLALDAVEETIPIYSGAYVYNEDADFWLRTNYTDNETVEPYDNTGVTADSLKISDRELSLFVGDFVQMTADVVPSYSEEKEVTWTSSDESIAEVLDSGLVIGKSAGTATITATTKDGTNIAETCQVTVSVPVEGVEIETTTTTTLYLGDDTTPADSGQLTAVITPENATDQSVTWKSSNSSVLKVDSNGVLTPLKKGTVTITCTSVSNPDVYATIRVTVKSGANPSATDTPTEEVTETPAPTEEVTETPAPTEEPSEEPTEEVTETPAPTDTPSEKPTETPTDAPETDAPTETPKTVYKLGDVNGNGGVDADDALQILRHVVRLIDISKLENGSLKLVLANADEDANDEITASDALVVLKMIVKLTPEKELEL